MCRYIFPGYKSSFVCVPCRHVGQTRFGGMTCPFCREKMTHAGHDFQAPRKRNDSGWAAVASVLASGKNYDSCGCSGPGYRPRTKAQVRQDANQRPWRPNGRP